jgi:hypothetical protein
MSLKQIEIDNIKNKLSNKIFNIYENNGEKYFIDNENKLIWNTNTDIVGIVYNNNMIFFNTIDNIISKIDSDIQQKQPNLDHLNSPKIM